MAVVVSGTATSNIFTESTHGPSGAVIKTTAPSDNGGDGSLFSPTDLVGTALGTCMLTIAGIWAKKFDIDISGATYTVEKHMAADPRRIARLPIRFSFPADRVPAERRAAMEAAAMACPVKRSLHPDTEVDVTFEYI